MARVLGVRNLSVRLRRRPILAGLDFDVEAGSALAVIGPNGAGKTVLFRALAGLIPHEGVIEWAKGTRLGYVPQKLDLERDLPLTGREYLEAMAQAARRPRTEIGRVLEAVHMRPGETDRLIGQLSGGRFQRLLVACALIGHPTVLLLDEATAGIDGPGQERIQEVIRRLQSDSGLTVLLVSHDLGIVYRYADQVLCLARGEAFFGPPEAILTPELLARAYGTEVRFHIHEHGGPRR